MHHYFARIPGKLLFVSIGLLLFLGSWLVERANSHTNSESFAIATTSADCGSLTTPTPTMPPEPTGAPLLSQPIVQTPCNYLPIILHVQAELTATTVPTMTHPPEPTGAP